MLRSIFYLLTFIITFNKVTAQRGGCTQTILRREVRELNDNELNQLHAAFNRLKEDGTWDRFCRTHLDNVPFAHSTPYFLPWHREFIFRFEQELKSINPSLTLPYWDWSVDSQAPERSAIFTPKYFGTMGGRCLDDGPYSDWVARYPNRHCLGRSFDGGNEIGSFTSPNQLRMSLGNADTFEDFWNRIEGSPHGNVHNNIGGDMSTMGSCNDPLFYLHHAMIDKLWYDWQNLHPDNLRSFGGPSPNGGRARLRDELVPFDKSVGDTMDVAREYCYTYSAGIRPASRGRGRGNRRDRRHYPTDAKIFAQSTDKTEVITPGPYDRKDMYHIRYPTPLPDSYITMMGLNKTRIREQEALLKAQTEQMNKSGFISEFALGFNSLLGNTLDESVKLVDHIITGNTLKELPKNVDLLLNFKKAPVDLSDLKVVKELLF